MFVGEPAKRDLLDLISDCVHCGFCLPACPTYESWGDEMDSPRGRIDLMKGLEEGALRLSDSVARHFDTCLGCMACLTACPSGVRYDLLIERTRAKVESTYRRSPGEALFRNLVFALFPYPRRLRALVPLIRFFQKSGLQRLARRFGLLRLLPTTFAQLDALMPPLDDTIRERRLPESCKAETSLRARVGLVAGCVQRVFFPNVNDATLRVLVKEGCDVVIPKAQGCCGALSLHSGRRAEAQRFARGLIAQFENERIDAVVVNAAGCGSALKEYDRLLGDDPLWADRARAFAAKVRDVCEFLAELGPQAERHPLEARIAYHDACHLAHAQRIRSQPRALLAAIPGLELIEIPEGDQCCGSAGTYNLFEPESAREIGLRKIENLLSTGARIVASGNPGCTLQMQSLLRERGITFTALHPIEILDASIGNSESAHLAFRGGADRGAVATTAKASAAEHRGRGW
jgi:glycolate oxidase iron-sulfur subunit